MPVSAPNFRTMDVALLCHTGVVDSLVWTGPGEGDTSGMTEPRETSIHPVDSQKPSSITDLFALLALRYTCASTSVS
jgi:hypothetical protein